MSARQRTQAFTRLEGWDLELAQVRVKDGAPTDGDFLAVPRDGYSTVDPVTGEIWVRVNGAWRAGGFLAGSTSGFAINNGGAATYANRLFRWQQLGNFVMWALSFDVTLAGSGAVAVTVTSLGSPDTSLGVHRVQGARSGSVTDWIARFLAGPQIALYIGAVAATGADMTVGTYGFGGVYPTA